MAATVTIVDLKSGKTTQRPETADEERTRIGTAEVRADRVRQERNLRIAACDWTRLDDVSKIDKDAWAKYRQALRDVPQQEGFPQDVKWPEAPA